MAFESDFLFGIDDRGKTIRFSKAERALLRQFTRSPKIVLNRDRLLDAISGQGSDASDRNIDFVINRLRRKLKDPARQPAYIATQYGEGYLWVAERAAADNGAAGAFLVLGPLRGLAYTGAFADHARTYAEALRAALDKQTAKDRKVVVDETCPPAVTFTGDKPQFTAELDFLTIDGRLDCAITLKVFATGQILWVSRLAVADDPAAGGALDRKAIKATAADITTKIWDSLAYPPQEAETPFEMPLTLRMYEASRRLDGSVDGWSKAEDQLRAKHWSEAEQRLRAALAQNPDDALTQLMLAAWLFAKYVTLGSMILPEDDFRARDEDEMERLVMASLPHLQANPVFMMEAGKLLYFLDRGHRPLAVELIESAFRKTSAFATSFAILGQIHTFKGDFEIALRLFDQGLELCEDRSEFQIYLLVLKCSALSATDDRKAIDEVLQLIYEKKPEARAFLPILYTSTKPGEVDPDALAMVEKLSERQANAMLIYANYIWARRFDDPEHRANILRPVFTLLVRRFGPGVVPDEVRASAPSLLAAVQNEATASRAAEPRRSFG